MPSDRVLLWSEIDYSGPTAERVYFWYDFETGRSWVVWEDDGYTKFCVPRSQSIVTFWKGL